MASRSKVETGNLKTVALPSSAYWAARLNERKHAEEELRAGYVELSELVHRQAAQLDVLREALRRESGERKRQAAAPKPPESDSQRAGTQDVSACGADLGTRLLERELAEEALRAEFIEMRRMVETQAAELRRLEDTLKCETAARQWAEAVLRRAQSELEESIAQRAALTGVDVVEGSIERQLVEEALRADFVQVGQMVKAQAAELHELKDTLQREITDRRRSESALNGVRVELGERINQCTLRSTDVADPLIEWGQAQKVLRTALVDLGRRVDRQSIELRSLEESLHRKVAERERSQEALQRMQADLEWRFGEQAARLDTISKALGGALDLASVTERSPTKDGSGASSVS